MASVPTPPASRGLDVLQRAARATGLPVSYFLCAPVALLALWAYAYPAGIDTPHHAELMRLWLDLRRGVPDTLNLYELRPLTPYTLPYVVAYPVARWFGPVVAIKFLLSLGVLGVPAMMARWLRAVGGDARLGVVGFAICFGYVFIWGFLPQTLGLALMFGYLVALERQGARPTVAQGLETVVWGLLLFFCHGVTFGLAMLSAAARLFFRPQPRSMWRAALHLVPLAALTLYWMARQESELTDTTDPWFADLGRLSMLFSGLFSIYVNKLGAALTAATLLAAWLFVRPAVNRRPAAWVPFAVASACFLVLPPHIFSAWCIGPRFLVYVQALGAGLWVPGEPRRDARFEWAPALLVLFCLLFIHARLYAWNRELAPFWSVAEKSEPGADIETFMPRPAPDSAVFGRRASETATAWLTAMHGGLLSDDYATRFNLPIRRKDKIFPTRYRYIFTDGTPADLAKAFPDAELRAQAGWWKLYERAVQTVGPFTVVRAAQADGELAIDASGAGSPLSMAGARHAVGFGTLGDSWIELRAPAGVTKVDGLCGLDDAATDDDELRCDVRLLDGRQLWTSPVLKKGQGPSEFSVELPRSGTVILEIFAFAWTTPGDWADIRS